MQRELASLVFSEKTVRHRRGEVLPAKFVSPSFRFAEKSTKTEYDWRKPMMGEMVSPHKRHGKPPPQPPSPEMSRPRSSIECLSNHLRLEQRDNAAVAGRETPGLTRPALSVSASTPSLRPRTAQPSSAGLPRAPPPSWPKWGAPPPEPGDANYGLSVHASASVSQLPTLMQEKPATPEKRPLSASPDRPHSLSLARSTSSIGSLRFQSLGTVLYKTTIGVPPPSNALTPGNRIGGTNLWTSDDCISPSSVPRPNSNAHSTPKPSWWGHAGSRSILDEPSPQRMLEF